MSVPKEYQEQADAVIIVKFANDAVGKQEVAIKVADIGSEE